MERTFSSFANFWSIALNSGTLKKVFENLDRTTINEIKNATKAALKVREDGQFSLRAHANAIRGMVE